jgi:hypothetical protein
LAQLVANGTSGACLCHVNLLRYGAGIIEMPRYLTVLSMLGMAEQELHGAQITGRAARVLSCRDASFRTTPAGELNIDALERSLPSKLA